ncbi:Alpha/beta hydrolase fold-1 [Bombardia bombarda]|uniref:Alpha/beta hydrolase fold-1 n=1 Tax=Bombardia bombarda TaxID=252184 RepID=A0AA39XBX0_9PEZI|nr:Alpha/beta hydrolase fold-1 [Bombardia bombarda]
MATAPATKPDIVIIHGGWHVPSSYDDLKAGLTSAGYEVHIPRLQSMNEARPPTAGLFVDTADTRVFVTNLVDKGRTVIAMMHSYGGQVGTNALYDLGLETRSAKGLPGGVSLLIYVCAFALPERGSMIQKVRDMGDEALMPMAFDFADDMTVLSRAPRQLLIGEGRSDADLDVYVASLGLWNGQCMYDEIDHCAWRRIPCGYIYTTKDMTVPHHYQTSMVTELEGQGRPVRTVTLETGHCPNFTAPSEMVKAVDELISGNYNLCV